MTWQRVMRVKYFRPVRYINKTYIRIPGGEIQYGHISGCIGAWFRGRYHCIRDARNIPEPERLMLRTTFRSFLLRHPDTFFLHHQGETFDAQGLTNRIATYLDADAYEDQDTGVIYTFREIARIVRPDEEEA